ncbi:hypothetical protein Q7C36_021942 [Tachysurus vachellii]|uniref:ATP synthase peripheral stalk subunit F6, mitochondrial n=1 Tax=Tachysurus vachellii TaxID=175792 RepID=A0AA88IPK9_TACVA|nr:hypothetical protein Q7C36_021942 [Tachysurus vachellii]
MVVLYNRVRRLNVLNSFHVECSFIIIRRTPGIVTLSTRKAKPKTITDIGNLFPQRASKAKEIQELVIGDVSLKAASQNVSKTMATTGPVRANFKTVEAEKPVIKSNALTFSHISPHCHCNIPEPTDTRDNLSTKASALTDLSQPVFTLFNDSLEGMRESSYISSNAIGEITCTRHAVPETGPAPASETYFGVITNADTVIPPSGNVPDLFPAKNDFIEATHASGDRDLINTPKNATSIGAVIVSEVNDLIFKDIFKDYAFNTCSLQIPYKDETVSHKPTPEEEIGSRETAYRLPFTEPTISAESAVQEVAVFSSQPKIKNASTEKSLDVKTETVFESNIIWGNKSLMGSDPACGELAEDELRAEEERSVQDVSDAQLDLTIQKLFLDKIREFCAESEACDGLLDVGPEYKKAFFLEEFTKLQRLYGNGDLLSFPEFKFSEPVLDENYSK